MNVFVVLSTARKRDWRAFRTLNPRNNRRRSLWPFGNEHRGPRSIGSFLSLGQIFRLKTFWLNQLAFVRWPHKQLFAFCGAANSSQAFLTFSGKEQAEPSKRGGAPKSARRISRPWRCCRGLANTTTGEAERPPGAESGL